LCRSVCCGVLAHACEEYMKGLPLRHKYVYTYMYVHLTKKSDRMLRHSLKCVTNMCIYIFVESTRHSNMHILKYVYIHISQFLVPFFIDMCTCTC